MMETSPAVGGLVDGTSPIPRPAPASQLTNSPAELLSPSQVRCFMDCQIRWWFKLSTA